MPDPIYGSVEFPNEILSSGIDAKAWVMIIVVILFIILWILGILVEFTSFGDHSKLNEEEREQIKIENRKSKLGLFFYSFSPINNVRKLFIVNKNGDQSLSVLNGVRVLSICWVVVGHSFNFLLLSPLVNIVNMNMLFESRLFALIPGGVYAVDTFFLLSGLLTCYLLAAKMYPKKGSTNFILIYFHRYYRLLFPVLFVEGVTVCIMPYLGDGPFYRQTIQTMSTNCKTYWWTNFLFINNLIPWKLSDQCISWVWYLANDFQFFLLTPPIIYVFCKNRLAGYAIFFVLILICMLYIDFLMKIKILRFFY